MKLNPELQRYGWLEFSRHRLIAMPLILGILVFLTVQATDHPAENLIMLCLTSYGLVIGVWGGFKAAEAVLQEIADNTWDFQRLSSLSPWSLTYGKLLGSPSYTWYGGLMVLLVFAYTAGGLLPGYDLFCDMILLLCSGVICHAMALLSTMQALQAIPGKRRLHAIGHLIVGLIAGGYFFFNMLILYGISKTGHPMWPDHIIWYSESYGALGFSTCYALLIAVWLVAGIYWQMRSQLRMRSGPWLWAGFVLFMMAYLSGFAGNRRINLNDGFTLFAAFFTSIAPLYLQLILEGWNGATYRRLRDSWRRKNSVSFLDQFPRWLASFIITFLCGAAVVLQTVMLGLPTSPEVLVTVLAMLAFIMRDIAILHFFKLNPSNRRPVASALFYLWILYFIVPWFLHTLGLHDLAHLFMQFHVPNGQFQSIGPMVSGIAQAIVASALARQRWKRYWQ